MPWFKIDDSAYSHRKFRAAGNAALGLWLRCGAYSAQHLLEGIVPGVIAKDFGTGPQASKLVKAGLWHTADHDCPRCTQPEPGDYVMHDFFEGGRNSTRAQVEASRRAAADRQAKARAAAAAALTDSIHDENRDAIASQMDSISSPDKVQTKSNRDSNESQFQDSTAAQGHLSRRDGLGGVTPSQASPYQTAVPPNGGTASQQGALATPLAADDIPVQARPLVDGLSNSGVIVRWPFRGNQWFPVLALIANKGIPAMTTCARQIAARVNVESANYFIAAWGDLPPLPAPGSQLAIPVGPNVVPLPSPATTRNQAARAGYAALAEELAQTQPGSAG